MKHLLVDITGHGYGHLAQMAAILNQFPEHQYRLSIRSSLPEKLLRERIRADFSHLHYEQDIGLVMLDGMQVDVRGSWQWYQRFHNDWEQHLADEQARLLGLKPDLLLANVGYLGIAAASRLQIPAIAVCSLNWADVFMAYCAEFPGAESIYRQIQDAYSGAEIFLQVQPAMPMSLGNGQAVEPIVKIGQKRTELFAESRGKQHVLVSLGGLQASLSADHLPVLDDVIWIVPEHMDTARKDMISQAAYAHVPYIDLLASVDMLITKTGYGALVEAVAHQKPVLCISRPGWPEEENLFEWSRQNGHFEQAGLDELSAASLTDAITRLLATQWNKPLVSMRGAQQVATIVRERLSAIS